MTFEEDILHFLDDRGWDGFSKREITLFLFYLAQKHELFDVGCVDLRLAMRTKMTKARLKSALVESWIRYGDEKENLSIFSILGESSSKNIVNGEASFYISNPVYREFAIDWLERKQLTPDFKNNRDILLLSPRALVCIADEQGILDGWDDEVLKDILGADLPQLTQGKITLKEAILDAVKSNMKVHLGGKLTQYLFEKMGFSDA